MQVQKVLQVTASLRQGGAEAMIMNVYEQIDRTRLQFDFLVYDDAPTHYTERVKELGGNVIVLKRHPSWNALEYWKKLSRILTEYGPYTAVHAHTNVHNALPLAVAKHCGIQKRISHSHSIKSYEGYGLLRKAFWGLMGKVIRRTATTFAACGTEAGYSLYGRKLFDDRGVVIHNPIAIEDYLSQKRADSLQKDCLTIGCVGSFREAKNHAFIVKIAAALKEKGIPFRMQFAGTGELEPEIRQMVSDQHLTDQIMFLGLRRDIPELMAQFDLLLMPSLYEGFPVTLIESQASGLPALISDRVPAEADLGMGLIARCALSDSLDQWVAQILKTASTETPDADIRRKILLEKGFDTASVVRELYQLYGVK